MLTNRSLITIVPLPQEEVLAVQLLARLNCPRHRFRNRGTGTMERSLVDAHLLDRLLYGDA